MRFDGGDPLKDPGFWAIVAFMSIPFWFALYELLAYGELR